ncbi:integrase core domain-containing protein, partial [Corynebacterium casei]|uniref:integrase core domain-containing protein n=1 Tax=Corynebacterium casei TaxID=160386 RepID=UPI003FD61FDA
IDALAMAHNSGLVAGNAVFHSDRGARYTSAALSRWATDHDVRLSVGGIGVCWDNAVAELFFSTLKLHLLFGRKQFATKLEARISVGEWIEAYYNRRRIHTSTGQVLKEAIDSFLTAYTTPAAHAALPTN